MPDFFIDKPEYEATSIASLTAKIHFSFDRNVCQIVTPIEERYYALVLTRVAIRLIDAIKKVHGLNKWNTHIHRSVFGDYVTRSLVHSFTTSYNPLGYFTALKVLSKAWHYMRANEIPVPPDCASLLVQSEEILCQLLQIAYEMGSLRSISLQDTQPAPLLASGQVNSELSSLESSPVNTALMNE